MVEGTNKKNINFFSLDIKMPRLQIFLFVSVLGIGSLLCIWSVDSPIPTLFLLLIATFFGLVLCHRTQKQLADPKLTILGHFWLIKILLSLILLYIAWAPNLEYFIKYGYGYDPIRYYWQAQELLKNGWSVDFLSINYVGILYYYAVVFYFFGSNPLAPMLINSFVTLIAGLFLIKICYEISPVKTRLDWVVAFVLLTPEIIWFDLMTSRETLISSLIVVSTLSAGRYLLNNYKVSLFKTIRIVVVCSVIIMAVRTSIIIPVAACVGLMAIMIRPQGTRFKATKIIFIILVLLIVLIAPQITAGIGGYNFSIIDKLNVESATSKADDRNWSNNSVGKLLIPNNTIESIVYVPLRMILYLASPPISNISISDLLDSNYVAWQTLLQGAMALANVIILFPLAVSSLIKSIRFRKKNSGPLMLHLAYWITFAAIAGGNLIIHPRYRVMATMLLVACAWLGSRTCSKKLICQVSFVWYFLLISGGVGYFAHHLDLF